MRFGEAIDRVPRGLPRPNISLYTRKHVMQVLLSPEGQDDFDALPRVIQARVIEIFERLERWPEVS
jgi:hypothetical protein